MKNFNREKTDLLGQRSRIIGFYSYHYYDKALVEVNDYLQKCPDDISMIALKASIYRHFKDFNMAISIIEEIPNHTKESVLELIRLYSCVERYEEALYLIKHINEAYELTDGDLLYLDRLSMVILKHKYPAKFFKNYLFGNYSKYDTYIENQLISYSVKDAIKYIQTNEDNNTNSNRSMFSKSFSIEEELPNIRKQLHKHQKNNSTYFDEYYVYYPNCGSRGNEICNYVKVYTIKGTNNIIKMKPVTSDRRYTQSVKENIDYSEYSKCKRNMIKRFHNRYTKK